MIGSLLKQLCVALWRFLKYKVSQITGSASTPSQPQTTERPKSASTEADKQPPPLPEATLADSYRRPARWSTSRRDTDRPDFETNPVYQYWKQHTPRAHKWTHYFEAYQAIFESRRPQPLRILEIGVYKGASLRLWKRYFGNPETVIVGIDIDQTCAQFDARNENIHVRIGSQADTGFLDTVTREFGPFDIIIDDGSHHSSHMIASFNHLFADALKNDGIYLAEDLHANYWLPWRDTRQSFLDLCKDLMEFMHAHYMQATLNEWKSESESESESTELSLDVPVIATMIKEIRVFDSIVAIYKTRREFMTRVLNPSAD
jgi:SAM-dependent methyltransferase